MRIDGRHGSFIIVTILTLILAPLTSFGQEEEDKKKIEEYGGEARQMIKFLQFSLNVLGDPTVPASEKDIIINESYLKIFQDEKVQVEDDLDENRDVVTNKDVQAYLKDVDFFFKNVTFDFNILDVAPDYNQDGTLFFTVKMMRNLKGITVDNDSINSDQERYVEINVDEENKDLRIASIYTTRLSRKEELTFWWAGLSREWKTFLGLEIEIKDGLLLSEIQQFSDTTYWADDILFTDSLNIIEFVFQAANREEINLASSKVISDLKPLDQLKKLKKLDISSSVITDLFPIRNLTTLEYLDCSNTKVDDLRPLRYSKSLKELYMSFTPISSITVIENFENLEVLHLEQTVIDSLPSIDKLAYLKDLNCASTNLVRLDSIGPMVSLESLDFSNTTVDDLSPIADLTNLKRLIFSKTNVNSLKPIASLSRLEEIKFENTQVGDISDLESIESLKSIYADESKLGLNEFSEFAKLRPEVEIIFISKDLEAYWKGLEKPWSTKIGGMLNFGDKVSSEELHQVLKVKKLVINESDNIKHLTPLKFMPVLEQLDFSGIAISDLSPLKHNGNLKVLKGAGSQVANLEGLEKLSELSVVDFSNCPLRVIGSLSGHSNIDTLRFDNTEVKNINILNTLDGFSVASFEGSLVSDYDVLNVDFDEKKSIVIYKSDKLRSWWGSMDDQWQDVFKKMDGVPSRPDDIQLHRLAAKRKLELSGNSVRNLNPVSEMVRLEVISFSDSRINSLGPISALTKLQELRCPGNPIADVEALATQNKLVVLDIENTQVKDLKPIQSLTKLKELKFSGTMVKDISPIEGMNDLEVLEFSKTRVRQVNALSSLKNLKVLKCYNNKISAKKIEEFKNNNPDCEVVFY